MEWFSGGISEAVEKSKRESALFIVAIFGETEDSRSLEDAVNSEPVQTSLSSTKTISIRLNAESQEHFQFKQIFPGADAPCLYFIAHSGAPVEIIQGFPSLDQVKERCALAVAKHLASLGLKNAQNTVPRGEPSTAPQAVPDPAAGSAPEPEQDSSTSASVSLEEKLERARQLAAARAKLKAEEAAEDARRREKERREAGRGMAELKRWQEEEEAKRMIEERKREKREEQALRQKLREQIAQDRAERNRASAAPANSEPGPGTSANVNLSVQSSAPKNYEGKARLQFRMPSGTSQTHTFEKDVTLGFVRNFLIAGEHVKFRNFSLCLAYPRREFTSAEYEMQLSDLGLLPSAALLVIPAGGLVSSTPSTGRFAIWDWFSTLLGYVLYPVTYLMSYFRALPAPSASGNNTAEPARPSGGGSSSAAAAARARKLDVQGSSSASGNIHRLKTQESDEDEDQGTWNGNSTQQKPK